jgi:hypothetical protein
MPWWGWVVGIALILIGLVWIGAWLVGRVTDRFFR